MGFLKRFFQTKITKKHIEDFYSYADAANWLGQWKSKAFRVESGIALEYTRENGKRIYHSIELYDEKWAGHIYIENRIVNFRYTESNESRLLAHCPITTGKKEIALITKEFFAWYNALNLPQAIDEVQKRTEAAPSLAKVKEIEVNAFGDKAVMRVMSDKKTFLIFNSFPPRKSKLTKQQADSFETLLSDAIKKKVIHDDRELFVIFDDSQKMIDEVISFLQSYSQ